MKPHDKNPGTPRIRAVAASEAEQVFREFVRKLSSLERPLPPLPPARRMNGHLRQNGARRARVAATAVSVRGTFAR